jgi:hypothetical protein
MPHVKHECGDGPTAPALHAIKLCPRVAIRKPKDQPSSEACVCVGSPREGRKASRLSASWRSPNGGAGSRQDPDNASPRRRRSVPRDVSYAVGMFTRLTSRQLPLQTVIGDEYVASNPHWHVASQRSAGFEIVEAPGNQLR